MAHKVYAVAPSSERTSAGQAGKTQPGKAPGKEPRSFCARGDGHWLFTQENGTQPAQAAGAKAPARLVKRNLLVIGKVRCKPRFNDFERNRSREQDAALGRSSGQFSDRKVGLARQRGGRIKLRAATAGKQKGAVRLAAILGNAIGVGKQEHLSGAQFWPWWPGRPQLLNRSHRLLNQAPR
jgi:hypothetical protein